MFAPQPVIKRLITRGFYFISDTTLYAEESIRSLNEQKKKFIILPRLNQMQLSQLFLRYRFSNIIKKTHAVSIYRVVVDVLIL